MIVFRVYVTSIFFLLFLFPRLGHGQLLPLQASYRNNWQLINPAATDRAVYFSRNDRGVSGSIWTLSGRQQWMSLGPFAEAPSTVLLGWEYWSQDHASSSGMRVGAQVHYHAFGAFSNIGLYVPLTYRAILDRRKLHSLFIAINPGLQLLQINQADLKFEQSGDPVLTYPSKRLLLNFASFGLFYTWKFQKEYASTLYAGISIPPGISKENIQSSTSNQPKKVPVYFLSGFRFAQILGNADLEPSILVRYLNQITRFGSGFDHQVSADFNLRCYWGGKLEKNTPYWVGIGYGANRTISTEVGFHLPGRSKIRLNLVGMYVLSGNVGLSQQSGVELTLNILNFPTSKKGKQQDNGVEKLRKGIRNILNGQPGSANTPL